MIISVEKLKQYITPDKTDAVLEDMLQALELSIRKYTNNNFQNRNIRFLCQAMTTKLYLNTPYLAVGDTIQISDSIYNNGLYTIEEIDEDFVKLDKPLLDEPLVLVTKVDYPKDVQMGVVDMIKWKLKNDSANDGDVRKKDIQSETLSRHSVTYATDSSEADLDEEFGVPKKHTAFLKRYKKARF